MTKLLLALDNRGTIFLTDDFLMHHCKLAQTTEEMLPSHIAQERPPLVTQAIDQILDYIQAVILKY